MKENADKARALDSAELHKQLRESSEQMFRLRFQMSMGQMDGVKKLRSLRKERARMLTVLRERQDGASPVAAQRPARAKSLPKPAAQETKRQKPAAIAKSKVAAAPKVRKEASQVKVKPTAAPKSAKISMPRKSGKG
jgi:large subunit ribosomal protein L29